MSPNTRGGRLTSIEVIFDLRDELIKEDTRRPMPMWSLRLPYSFSTRGFLAVGGSESGRSTAFEMLISSVFDHVNGQSDNRALVFDHKNDTVPYSAAIEAVDAQDRGLGFGIPYKILNPADARCVAWDIAADIVGPGPADAFVGSIIPVKEGQSSLVDDAARGVLKGVLLSLMSLLGKSWTLRDVINAILGDVKDLVRILNVDRRNAYLVRRYLAPQDLGLQVLTRLSFYIEPLAPIAIAWECASEKVSIRQWLNGSYVLVLGTDGSAAVDVMNRSIFRVFVDLVKGQQVSKGDSCRTWVILEDIVELGRLDGLSELVAFRGSKGACVALGLQDLPSFIDVYGESLAHSILGLLENRALLRTNCPTTALWMSCCFGSVDSYDPRAEESVSPLVLPSEFQVIPAYSDGSDLIGYYQNGLGWYRDVIKAGTIAPRRHSRVVSEPGFVESDLELDYPSDWSDEERVRLGLAR